MKEEKNLKDDKDENKANLIYMNVNQKKTNEYIDNKDNGGGDIKEMFGGESSKTSGKLIELEREDGKKESLLEAGNGKLNGQKNIFSKIKNSKKTIIIVSLVLLIFLIALILGLVFGIKPKKKSGKEYRIIFDDSKNWTVVYNNFDSELKYVATAFYDDSLMEKGFDILAIETNDFYSDEIQAEGAGYLEGVITKDRIYNHFLNSYESYYEVDEVKNFFDEQEQFVFDEYERNQDDPVVYNAYLLRKQYQGIRNGYNSVADNDHQLSKWQFDIIASNTDLSDVLDKYSKNKIEYKKMTEKEFHFHFLKKTHCSALWKVKNDFSDIIFGHNTWSPYSYLVRILKEYKFNFKHPSNVGKSIIFSSYPATLASLDDFYVTSQKLVIIETTNTFYNDELYDNITSNTYLSWERAMIASRITKTSAEWTKIFSRYNSGTTNNQWMILDGKKVNLATKEIDPDAFYIVEQLPGICIINNVTDHLKSGYWPSYNNAYDPQIRNLSHLDDVMHLGQSELDYENCTRAKIFRRDQSKVNSINDLKHLLRSNNYLTDEYLNGDPSEAISCRAEINGLSCFGAYDSKVSSVSSLSDSGVKIQIIAGPTYEGEGEPFDFDKFEVCKSAPHYGIKNPPKFDWFEYVNKFPF